MSLVAIAIGLAVALPLGLVLGHLRKGVLLATNISNVGRAVPTLAVLIIFASIPSIGVGDDGGGAGAGSLRHPAAAHQHLRGDASVDADVLDAGAGMGMGRRQRLFRVEMPLASPLILAGVRTATVQVVATASLAALVGGGGLGRYVVDGFALQDTTMIVAGAILTALLAICAEGALALFERVATPRGLRHRRAETRISMADAVS